MNREAYTAPEANWVLLAPAEDLMLGEINEEDAFALGGWGGSAMSDSIPGGVITGGGSSGGDGD